MRVITAIDCRVPSGGTEDWCTLIPDKPFGYYFGLACMRHDQNYSAGSPVSRAEADAQFFRDMKEVCRTTDASFLCTVTAGVYYAGVRAFGGLFYNGDSPAASVSNVFSDGAGGYYVNSPTSTTHIDSMGHEWGVYSSVNYINSGDGVDPAIIENAWAQNCQGQSLDGYDATTAAYAIGSNMIAMMFSSQVNVNEFADCAAQLNQYSGFVNVAMLEYSLPDGSVVTGSELLLAASAMAETLLASTDSTPAETAIPDVAPPSYAPEAPPEFYAYIEYAGNCGCC